jgi:HlyD family secretion protein
MPALNILKNLSPVGQGEPTLAPAPAVNDNARGEIRAGVIALAIFFGLFVGWAAFAPLDAAVVAPGVVVVSGNRQTVQHRDGGIVSRLNVIEGQSVAAGDVLVELAAPEILAQDQALLSQMLDLQMQRQRILGEMRGERSVSRPAEWEALVGEDRAAANDAFERHRRAYGAGRPRTGFQARVEGYSQEIAALNRQEALLEDELAGMRELAAEQLVPLTRVRALERALAELQGRRADMRAQVAVAQEDRGTELRSVEARLAETIPRFIGAREQVERTRLRAPVSGVVVGLSVHTVGGVIGPGDRVLDIVPESAELIVEAQVRPEDADDLRTGMATEVRITAFHGRDMPIVDGVVRNISADRFVDQQTGAGYFAAQIAVPPEEIAALAARGRSAQLSAGLPAEVLIPTRKRTALQYLLEPLNQSLWRSFRET